MRYATKDEKVIPRVGDKGGKIYSITVIYDDDTGIIFGGGLLDEYEKRNEDAVSKVLEECKNEYL